MTSKITYEMTKAAYGIDVHVDDGKGKLWLAMFCGSHMSPTTRPRDVQGFPSDSEAATNADLFIRATAMKNLLTQIRTWLFDCPEHDGRKRTACAFVEEIDSVLTCPTTDEGDA